MVQIGVANVWSPGLIVDCYLSPQLYTRCETDLGAENQTLSRIQQPSRRQSLRAKIWALKRCWINRTNVCQPFDRATVMTRARIGVPEVLGKEDRLFIFPGPLGRLHVQVQPHRHQRYHYGLCMNFQHMLVTRDNDGNDVRAVCNALVEQNPQSGQTMWKPDSSRARSGYCL